MKIAFLGTPSFVQPIKDTLVQHFSLVDSLNEADLAVVAAYGKILTKKELNAPKYGCINIHPSLLPKYRGPSPIQAAILHGDNTSGITIIKIDEDVDHGPIIYQEKFGLSQDDTFDSLSQKMFSKASEILPSVIKDFTQGKITSKTQDDTLASYCPKLSRESGYFDINNPPPTDILDRMIRAYYPWPGVWTKWKGKIVKFLPNNRHPEQSEGSSHAMEDSSLIVQNDKFLIQMEGKKVITTGDFLNGYPDFPVTLQ